jgi:hypothetical protein
VRLEVGGNIGPNTGDRTARADSARVPDLVFDATVLARLGAAVTGGYTAFDNSIPALQAIQAEWTRTDLSGSALQQYQTRIDYLMGGPGGLNGGVFLTRDTVFFDSAATNQLIGGTGLDWFWAASVAEILNLQPGEGD